MSGTFQNVLTDAVSPSARSVDASTRLSVSNLERMMGRQRSCLQHIPGLEDNVGVNGVAQR